MVRESVWFWFDVNRPTLEDVHKTNFAFSFPVTLSFEKATLFYKRAKCIYEQVKANDSVLCSFCLWESSALVERLVTRLQQM